MAFRRPRTRHPVPRKEGWLQVNCALFPQGPGLPPFVPWRDLTAALDAWRAEDRFGRCFFVRKPPGLRLRFAGARLDERLAPVLVAWLEEAEQRDSIRSFRFAVYEPEVFRFGGPAGMAIAHDHFDRDTRLALRYESLQEDERAGVGRDLLSLAITGDLFGRCVEDGAEFWDIWQRLGRALGPYRTGDPGTPTDLERTRAAAVLAQTFLEGLPPALAELLEVAHADNAAIVARLRAAAAAGQMTVGPRAWLAAACVFHWNRFGLTAAEIGPMTARMDILFNPHGGGV